MTASPNSRMGTSLRTAAGSLADRYDAHQRPAVTPKAVTRLDYESAAAPEVRVAFCALR